MKYFSWFFLVPLIALPSLCGCGDSSSRGLTSSDVDENPFANSATTVQSDTPRGKSKRRSARAVTNRTKRQGINESNSAPQPRSSPEITRSYGLVSERDKSGRTKKQHGATPSREAHISDSLLGKPAPDIDIMKLGGGTLNPRNRRSSKILMLVFWTSYNPLCEKELSILQRIAKDYSHKNVELLAVNDGENQKTIHLFLKNQKLKIPVGIDLEQEVATTFNVNQLPYLAIIDKQGIIQGIHQGFITTLYDEVKKDLDDVLLGR